MNKLFKIRLQKGDMVMVRAGREKGKTGKVVATHPLLNKVTIEGVNVVKKAIKPNRLNPRGGIVELTKPIWVSKVGLIDSTGKKISRVGYQFDKSGKKARIYKSSGKPVPAAPETVAKKAGRRQK